MRTIKDRVMLIMDFFGKERIHDLLANESLCFIKGAVFNCGHSRDACEVAARFALTDYSYGSPLHDNDACFKSFRVPFSQIENDESKILQVYLTDRQLSLYQYHELDIPRQFKVQNHDVFAKLYSLSSTVSRAVHLRYDIEEFEGVVSLFYTLIFDFGDFRGYHFKTRSLAILEDDLFLESIQHFAKIGFNHSVSIDALKNDFFKEIDNFPPLLPTVEYEHNLTLDDELKKASLKKQP